MPPAPTNGNPLRARRRPPRIFLDNAASASPDPVVVERVTAVQHKSSANPSSVHRPGLRAMREVELARNIIAEKLGATGALVDGLIFTSGGTEANNLALKGAVWAAPRDRRHLLVSAIEHPCVLDTADWLAQTGQAEVDRLPVDRMGRVSPDTLRAHLRPDTLLVSVMHANNEVGTVQPLRELAQICREHGTLLHTDACQSFCKVPLDVSEIAVDLITVNAHKVHGPKGVGALWARPGVELTPLQHGGGHEGGLRSGTLNVAGIAGFGEAVLRFGTDEAPRMASQARAFLQRLRAAIPSLRLNGEGPDGAGNIINISVPGLSGKQLFMDLDRRGIAVSSSSACHATKLTPSHVLLAMGYEPQEADEALRISLGRFTKTTDLDALYHALIDLIALPEC